jgi:hypothetical protein
MNARIRRELEVLLVSFGRWWPRTGTRIIGSASCSSLLGETVGDTLARFRSVVNRRHG